MVRVCPKRDAVCPHGMNCPYVIDRYECKLESPMTDKAPEPLDMRAAMEQNARAATEWFAKWEEAATALEAAQARIAELEAERNEARRRRDEWRKKAEGYDAVRLALREKVGAPWPPNMSRALWAGIAADEKKRADDAEIAVSTARREAYTECAAIADGWWHTGAKDHSPGDDIRATLEALEKGENHGVG